jgi:hypothetical protein
MFYVGLDIHAKHIAICVLNETGQFVAESTINANSGPLRLTHIGTSRHNLAPAQDEPSATTAPPWPLRSHRPRSRDAVDVPQSYRIGEFRN